MYRSLLLENQNVFIRRVDNWGCIILYTGRDVNFLTVRIALEILLKINMKISWNSYIYIDRYIEK